MQEGKIRLTRKDPNPIIKLSDYAEIILFDGKQIEYARVEIDLDDVPKIEGIRWQCSKYKGGIYPHSKQHGFLHRLLAGATKTVGKLTPDSQIVDHIDRNTLNCRKNNLRIVTPAINARNRSTVSKNASGRVGVCYIKKESAWEATISIRCKDMQTAISVREWLEDSRDANV